MLRQKYYNEKPIKGYNHLLGTLDAKLPSSGETGEGILTRCVGYSVLTRVSNVLDLQV